MLAASAAMNYIVFSHVSGAFLSLRDQVRNLEKLPDSWGSPVLASRIHEARLLQSELWSLRRRMQTFIRFLPESVVKGIVSGEERFSRLHVAKRNVTIMFSDIRDFTTVAEALDQADLLLLLTRYLSVMTRIVEGFEGVVAEILGDGLLVFWNTPDRVADHATKACEAALAMQEVLHSLNNEFGQHCLPTLFVRTGIHTGKVLTGNIGSESHMKFGCIGDAVNLASRLEGLCKFYGVSTLISETLMERASHDDFEFRELDLVQVKGRNEPLRVFELAGFAPKTGQSNEGHEGVRSPVRLAEVGRACYMAIRSSTKALTENTSTSRFRSWLPGFKARDPEGDEGLESTPVTPSSTSSRLADIRTVTPLQIDLMERYERGLKAFQLQNFLAAHEALTALALDHPEDVATQVLLQRVCEYVSADGTPTATLSEEEMLDWTGVRKMFDK